MFYGTRSGNLFGNNRFAQTYYYYDSFAQNYQTNNVKLADCKA